MQDSKFWRIAAVLMIAAGSTSATACIRAGATQRPRSSMWPKPGAAPRSLRLTHTPLQATHLYLRRKWDAFVRLE